MTLSVEDLLFAGSATHAVSIPAQVLRPTGSVEADRAPVAGTVTLRPLRLADLQRVQKAGGEQQPLTAVLMVQMALVEPALSIEQVSRLHAGLVQFLLGEVNRISGLSLGGTELAERVQAPLARACFLLAREFGWTPEQCAQLSLGQVLLYLEMLGQKAQEAGR